MSPPRAMFWIGTPKTAGLRHNSEKTQMGNNRVFPRKNAGPPDGFSERKFASNETMQSTATQSCGDPLSFGPPWISEVQRKGRADQVRLGLVQPTVDGRCRLARKTLTNPTTAVVLLEELIRDVGSELAR